MWLQTRVSLVSVPMRKFYFLKFVCILQCDFSVEKNSRKNPPLFFHFEDEKPEAQKVSYVLKFIKYSIKNS